MHVYIHFLPFLNKGAKKLADTYDRRCQLGASRRRFEDASVLHSGQRWQGSIYMGGYAIECSLKALICYESNINNFKESTIFIKGAQGASLHNLQMLFSQVPSLKRVISLDRTNQYKNAWNTITSTWAGSDIRYSNRSGSQENSRRFLQAVKIWHALLLTRQGEAS